VTFTPTALGGRAGSLMIAYNNGVSGSVQTAALTGTGLGLVSLSVNSLALGAEIAGGRQLRVKLTNTGNASLTISRVAHRFLVCRPA
jgi:hypothetical protein